MNNSDHASEHVEHIDDDGIDEQLPVLDAIANAFDAEYYGAWTFCTLVRGAEWNPALFTSVLNECSSKLETFKFCSSKLENAHQNLKTFKLKVPLKTQTSSHMHVGTEVQVPLSLMVTWRLRGVS